MIRWVVLIAAMTGVLLLEDSQAAHRIDGLLGIGVGKRILERGPFERFGSVGMRYGGQTWKVQTSAGYWMAPAHLERHSFYGSLQGGVQVEGKGGTYAQMMFGPALISQDDCRITGMFQFHLTGGLGIVDDNGTGVSLLWTHFSNAGIKQPNLGRDILTLRLIIPVFRR
jgi:hypothetical protein